MPVTHNKGPLHPNHPFAQGLIVSGQKRPDSSKQKSERSQADADPMQAGIDAHEAFMAEFARKGVAEARARRAGAGAPSSPAQSPSGASTTRTPQDSAE